MNWIKNKLVAGTILHGAWLTSGSDVLAEIAGLSGFDWLLIDMEHGLGDYDSMLRQLQVLSATPAAPIVRVRSDDIGLIKQALDAGASGIMVPLINSAEQARQAISYMRYPPEGVRGLTTAGRASEYGNTFGEYFEKANESILKIVQIETAEAVENIEGIAAVEGVDVLFVGPADLSLNLGIPGQMNDPVFRNAIAAIAAATRKHDKRLGILVGDSDHCESAVADGFTFVAMGVDVRILAQGFETTCQSFKKVLKKECPS